MVVDFARAVYAQADEETVRFEKLAPFFIEERAVGLQIVFDALAGPGVFFLECDGFAVELQTQQGGFAALPGKDHFAARRRFDVLFDEQFQGFVRHGTRARTFGQGFLAEVVAIGTIEVAGGPDRLGHDVETLWLALRRRRRRLIKVYGMIGSRIHAITVFLNNTLINLDQA